MRTRLAIALTLLAALIPVLPASGAGPVREVKLRDNVFEPQQIFVDVGDTVTWDGGGFRQHTVTSDTKLFDSGRMGPADEFSFTFKKKGKYYYHCTLHGAKQKGMWGVVIVGDLPKDGRRKIYVPDDYPTIQEAVFAAKPGAVVVVRPGTYSEEVRVDTDRLVIKGSDRFRTVLDGGGSLATGFNVTGSGVVIKDLTATNYVEAGIRLENADDYAVRRVDLVGNGAFGIESLDSNGGSIKESFAWGSGQAGIHVGRCFACGIIVDDVKATMNVLGIEIVNATGVTVRDSRLKRNGVGLLAHSDAALDDAPGRALFLLGNEVSDNNQDRIPPAGAALNYGLPFGTGIWLAGVKNTTVLDNTVALNSRYGVVVTDDLDNTFVPINNKVQDNEITGSGSALDLAWDGSGTSNCFDGNAAGNTGPPGIQDLYPCGLRPFPGVPYEPVASDIDEAIAAGPRTDTVVPPRPHRPACQRGKPGCKG